VARSRYAANEITSSEDAHPPPQTPSTIRRIAANAGEIPCLADVAGLPGGDLKWRHEVIFQHLDVLHTVVQQRFQPGPTASAFGETFGNRFFKRAVLRIWMMRLVEVNMGITPRNVRSEGVAP